MSMTPAYPSLPSQDEGKTETFMCWEVGGLAEKVVSRNLGWTAHLPSQPQNQSGLSASLWVVPSHWAMTAPIIASRTAPPPPHPNRPPADLAAGARSVSQI